MTNLERLAKVAADLRIAESSATIEEMRAAVARQLHIIEYVTDIPERNSDAKDTRYGIVLALAKCMQLEGSFTEGDMQARRFIKDALNLLIH